MNEEERAEIISQLAQSVYDKGPTKGMVLDYIAPAIQALSERVTRLEDLCEWTYSEVNKTGDSMSARIDKLEKQVLASPPR